MFSIGLTDNDLSDDVSCLQQIVKEKGLHEWYTWSFAFFFTHYAIQNVALLQDRTVKRILVYIIKFQKHEGFF